MTAVGSDPTSLPWPYWMLRYVGSDDREALNAVVWSVGGSPPWGGVSYEEAAAVYELLEDYRGAGAAADASYAAVLAVLEPGSEAGLTVEVFRCADEIHSDPEGFGRGPVRRGLELSQRLGDMGAEASFLSFEAGWHTRQGDDESARGLTRKALDMFLELAEADEAYARRVHQSATNAVSLTARTGDLDGARRLLDDLADVIDPDVAEQLRRALASAS
jgi:hypothetical protein